MIFSNTGVALLAYMDGINRTTLGGVVLGAAAAAASAVYKVWLLNILWHLFLSIFIKPKIKTKINVNTFYKTGCVQARRWRCFILPNGNVFIVHWLMRDNFILANYLTASFHRNR